MSTKITNTDDIIYASDITKRIKELEEVRDDPNSYDEFTELYKDEYDKLKAFADDIDESAFENDESLISEHYFEEYAKGYVLDIGAIADELSWPVYHIAWKDASDELKGDYTSANFDGTEYYYRM